MQRREFHFSEGSSDKFWAIELEGKQFTVQFGRTGTSGQTQLKEFGTEAESVKAYEKLIAEKIKKGYQEVTTGQPAATSTAKPAAAATSAKSAKPPKKADAEASAPTVVEPPAPVTSTEVVRRLHLSPAELTLKTGATIQRPEPRPFDLESCLQQLQRVTKGDGRTGWDWAAAEIPESMTAQEADFWLQALLKQGYKTNPRAIAKELREHTFDSAAAKKAVKNVTLSYQHQNHWFMLPIANLLSAEEIFDCMAGWFQEATKQRHAWPLGELTDSFGRFVRPYLPEAQLKAMRKVVLESLDLNAPWPDLYHPLPFEYYMAAVLGLSKETRQIVARISDTTYGKTAGWNDDHYQQPQILVLRLGEPALVESEMRRTKLLLRGREQIRAWLAITEWHALNLVRDSILDIDRREEVAALIEAFGQAIEAPEAAVTMLELKLQSKAPNVARQWLDEHLGCASAGLIPVAGGKGKVADAALDFLREQKRQGHGDLIAKLLQEAPDSSAARVRQEVLEREEKVYPSLDDKTTPAWFKKEGADLKAPNLPDWLPLAALPPILVDERRLRDDQVSQVIAALQKSTFDKEHPLLAGLKRRFNFETVQPIDNIEEEMSLVQRETDRLLARAGVPLSLRPEMGELLVTTFHELRTAKTAGGKALEPLSTAMSTAEAVSTGYAAGIHAYYYGGGAVAPNTWSNISSAPHSRTRPTTSRNCGTISTTSSRTARARLAGFLRGTQTSPGFDRGDRRVNAEFSTAILDLTAPVVFFPVRHHSPACARLVVEAMRRLKPAVLLVEGPADFNDRMPELALPHRLPIAIYTYARLRSQRRVGRLLSVLRLFAGMAGAADSLCPGHRGALHRSSLCRYRRRRPARPSLCRWPHPRRGLHPNAVPQARLGRFRSALGHPVRD